MNTELLTRVAELRDLRTTERNFAKTLDDLQDTFNDQWASLIEDVKRSKAATAAAETALKAVVASEYEKTGEAKPCPGVAVQLLSTLDYVEKVAFDWCKQAGIAITPESLNHKEFEKIAKAAPLAFVTYSQTPRVTISTDLTKALASVGATAEASV